MENAAELRRSSEKEHGGGGVGTGQLVLLLVCRELSRSSGERTACQGSESEDVVSRQLAPVSPAGPLDP